MCNCSGGNCKCAPFNTGKAFAKSVGNSYVASEKKKNSATSGRVPIGRRGSRPIGKR